MAITYTGTCASPKISGTGLGNKFIFAIENANGSNTLVSVKRMQAFLDATAVLTSVKPAVTTYRSFNLSFKGSCQLSKGTFNTTQTSDPYVRLWCALTPDNVGQGELSITEGPRLTKGFAHRMHTLYGRVLPLDVSPLDECLSSASRNLWLYPGESITLEVEPVAVANDPATNSWLVNCVWTENTLTTFTISGTVTFNSSPVVGAEVLVVCADDTSLTNAYIQGVILTTAGGAWTCNIPVGKIAYAYAQNDVTGTLYTAPAAPFLS